MFADYDHFADDLDRVSDVLTGVVATMQARGAARDYVHAVVSAALDELLSNPLLSAQADIESDLLDFDEYDEYSDE